MNASLSFEHEGTLTLAPGQSAQVTTNGSPPAPYAMSFALVGSTLDASLDRAVVVADPTGRATVSLRAPAAATNFVLRATIKDGPSADLPVSVSGEGFGSLLVVPEYSGPRSTREWKASVLSGTTCEALAPAFPDDPEGALTASAEPGDPLLIEGAPVGPNLAVFVRGGHYMWGCKDEPNLAAEKTTTVTVHVVGKPIDLGEANLTVELGFTPEPLAWQELVDDSVTLLTEGFAPQPQTEAGVLLDAMADAHTDPGAFDDARSSEGWDGAVATYWMEQGLALRGLVQSWAEQWLATQPEAILGRMATLDAAAGHGLFALDAIGGLAPEQTGSPKEYVMSWLVDPDDTVRLSGVLYWLPSRLLGAGAEQAALAQDPGQTDLPGALAAQVDCDALALVLGDGLDGCTESCLGLLCEAALADRWALALSASADAGLVGDISLTGSGAALFDDTAALTGFTGEWLGYVTSGVLSADVEGVLSAQTSENPVIE